MRYTVFVDDNFHYGDSSERYKKGEYETPDAALASARSIVDEYLESATKPQMTADELYKSYTTFGPDPFISPADETAQFSAWEYAKARCAEIRD